MITTAQVALIRKLLKDPDAATVEGVVVLPQELLKALEVTFNGPFSYGPPIQNYIGMPVYMVNGYYVTIDPRGKFQKLTQR